MKGEEVHCVRDRAHLVRFDVAGEPNDGSSMKGIERALISVEPSPAHTEHCQGKLGFEPAGDKQFCYGVNEDSTCDGAQKVLPIKDGFECKNCYVSAKADAFYKLNYSLTELNSVTVGLKGIQLRAAAGVHRELSGSGTLTEGSYTFPGSDKTITLMDRLVGCPVCVRVTIKVGAPTSLEYSLKWNGQGEADAGATLDLDLGDNYVHYDSKAGWHHQALTPTHKVEPMLEVKANAEADLKLTLKTSLQVNVDNIVWYHLNMDPSLPLKLTIDGGFGPFKSAKVCLDGDALLNMEQEANLDWNLLKWHAKDHWGPSKLYSWEKRGIVHACKGVQAENSSALVV
uniref:Uncharacterized protein n=1 Tax=Alexandrium andersonii TaxID=327968 RepID=A0A7S2BUE6_9DINO